MSRHGETLITRVARRTDAAALRSMGAPAPLTTFDVASASAPTNIAVVKYWGKDEARGGNTPINSSCSLTLDPADLRAETVMVASPELDRDELWLNGAPVDVAGASTHARRLRACLATMRARCARPPAGSRASAAAELAGWRVRVISRNTFPTAAGLASSAAGYAALVRCAAALYGVAVDASLSGVARVGSGSACRSLDGGLVAWRKGAAPDASDSLADPLHAADHWPGLRVVVVVASADEKETPSTEGMRRSVATSPFLAHRAAAVAEPRVAELAAAFGARDFAAFGELCARPRGARAAGPTVARARATPRPARSAEASTRGARPSGTRRRSRRAARGRDVPSRPGPAQACATPTASDPRAPPPPRARRPPPPQAPTRRASTATRPSSTSTRRAGRETADSSPLRRGRSPEEGPTPRERSERSSPVHK